MTILKKVNQLFKNHNQNFTISEYDEFIANVKINQNFDLYEVKLKNEKNKSYNSEDRPWLIIRYTYKPQEFGYKLKEGDLLKLGKMIFKINEIKIKKDENFNFENPGETYNKSPDNIVNIQNENHNFTIYETNDNNVINHTEENINLNENENEILNLNHNLRIKKNFPICRICLSEEHEYTNPLINPCACSGTMKYIHLNCLKLCLKTKIQIKVMNFLIAHFYKNFECELCKKIIPEKIKIKNKIYSLIDLQTPENNYIVLESLKKEKSENKFVFIIHMKDRNKVKIGRASDADVRIIDISVSRNHAEIKLINGSFYISDNSSKFGTLVRVTHNLIVLPDRPLAIQMNRNFLLFKMNKKLCAKISCYKSKEILYYDYNEYFAELDLNKSEINNNLIDTISKYSSDNEDDEEYLHSISNIFLDTIQSKKENIINNIYESKRSEGMLNNLVNEDIYKIDNITGRENILNNSNQIIYNNSGNNNPSILLNININLRDNSSMLPINSNHNN